MSIINQWPREVVEQVLIDNLGSDYTESGDGSHWRFNSVFTDDRKKRLNVNLNKYGVFICFKSGEKGNFEYLISQLMGISVQNAINHIIANYLSGQKILSLVKEERTVDPILLDQYNQYELREVNLPPGCQKIDDDILALPFYNYLKKRLVPEHYIRSWYYCLSNNKNQNLNFFEMVVIPVYQDNRLVYYIGRSINKSAYMQHKVPAEESTNKKSRIIWNYNTEEKTVILLEGIFDAVRFGNNGMALFGKEISEDQIELLKKKNLEKIIVALDNDFDFDKAPKKVIEIFEKLRAAGLPAYMFDWPAFCKKFKLKVKDFGDIKLEHIKVKILDDFLLDDPYLAKIKFLTK